MNAADGKNALSNLTVKQEATFISGFLTIWWRRGLSALVKQLKTKILPQRFILVVLILIVIGWLEIQKSGWKFLLSWGLGWKKLQRMHDHEPFCTARCSGLFCFFWNKQLCVQMKQGTWGGEILKLRMLVVSVALSGKRIWHTCRCKACGRRLDEEDRQSLGRVSRYVTHIRILQSKTKSIREVTSNSAEVLSRWKRWQKKYLSQMKGRKWVCLWDWWRWSRRWYPWKRFCGISSYNTLNVNWRNIIDRCGSKLKGPIMSDHKYTIYSLRSTCSGVNGHGCWCVSSCDSAWSYSCNAWRFMGFHNVDELPEAAPLNLANVRVIWNRVLDTLGTFESITLDAVLKHGAF